MSKVSLLHNQKEEEADFVCFTNVNQSETNKQRWSCLPGAALWPCCAASLCTAEQPE